MHAFATVTAASGLIASSSATPIKSLETPAVVLLPPRLSSPYLPNNWYSNCFCLWRSMRSQVSLPVISLYLPWFPIPSNTCSTLLLLRPFHPKSPATSLSTRKHAPQSPPSSLPHPTPLAYQHPHQTPGQLDPTLAVTMAPQAATKTTSATGGTAPTGTTSKEPSQQQPEYPQPKTANPNATPTQLANHSSSGWSTTVNNVSSTRLQPLPFQPRQEPISLHIIRIMLLFQLRIVLLGILLVLMLDRLPLVALDPIQATELQSQPGLNSSSSTSTFGVGVIRLVSRFPTSSLPVLVLHFLDLCYVLGGSVA